MMKNIKHVGLVILHVHFNISNLYHFLLLLVEFPVSEMIVHSLIMFILLKTNSV